MNTAEQVKKLYEDAVVNHMLGKGYSEERVRAEAQKISNIIVKNE
ncbi:MAG: hypothetical protein NT038_06625 [Euryarchaeota archaeon]|nr:hypothetical protein [Euryarchaeota archaeon]